MQSQAADFEIEEKKKNYERLMTELLQREH
jgi:hypothetical protein